jgi:REP element-mobilizing transposase RayT
MREWQSQAHVKHYCKYHVVFVPKYRKKSIYGTLRKDIGGILRERCRQHGVELVEGYAMKDHIHMLLMIPPKFSVANTIGFLKGKSGGAQGQALQLTLAWLAGRYCEGNEGSLMLFLYPISITSE